MTRLALLAFMVSMVACGGAHDPPPSIPESDPELMAQAGVDSDDLVGDATWYGEYHHGRTTASGEPFDMYAMTAAHKTLPFDTVVRVTRQDTLQSVVVRINDRGPFGRGRIIDLSMAAAEEIDMIRAGVVPVVVEILEVP